MQHITSEVKMTGIKLVGGAATYAGSHEVAQTWLQKLSQIDPAVVTSWASAFAAVMTAIYFAAQFAYTIWKWRRESKRGN